MSRKRSNSGLVNVSTSSSITISTFSEGDNNSITSTTTSVKSSIPEKSLDRRSSITSDKFRNIIFGKQHEIPDTTQQFEGSVEPLPIVSNITSHNSLIDTEVQSKIVSRNEAVERDERFESQSSLSSCSELNPQALVEEEAEEGCNQSHLLEHKDQEQEPEFRQNLKNILQFFPLLNKNSHRDIITSTEEIPNMGNKSDIQRCCHPMFARQNSSSSVSAASSTSTSQSRRVIFPTLYNESNQVDIKVVPPIENGASTLVPIKREKIAEEPIPTIISLQSNKLPQSQLGNKSELKHVSSNDDSMITNSTSSISYGKRNHSYDEGCGSNEQFASDHSTESEEIGVASHQGPSSPNSQQEKMRTYSVDSETGKAPRRPSILRNGSWKSPSPVDSTAILQEDNTKVQNKESERSLSSCPFPAGPPNNNTENLSATVHELKINLNDESSTSFQQDLPDINGRSLRKSLSDSCLNELKMKKLFASARIDSADSISCTSSLLTSRIENKSGQTNSERRRAILYGRQMTRHISHEEIGRNKIIRFDPRIWVHEIQCPPVDKIWYSESDMNRFKCEAVLRIRKWTKKMRQRRLSQTIIPTGTGRIVSHGDNLCQEYLSKNSQRIIYTNPALSCEAEDDDDEVQCLAKILSSRETALQYEFRSVLIVDNHDLFLNLLSKGVKLMLPHVKIATASTVDQALKEIEKANASNNRRVKTESCSHGFDLIIIEDRLVPLVQPQQKSWNRQRSRNGCSLIEKIKKDIESTSPYEKFNKRHPLVVGISAYLDHDKQRLLGSGSDFVWGKPPPKMNDDLRMILLRRIMEKRNRPNTKELFT